MERRKISHKTDLSADAKLIIALIRKQPQTKDALCKVTGIHLSTFYRILPLMKERGIIKETEGGFALWKYMELEKAVEKALHELKKKGLYISFNKIASEVGVHPNEIEFMIYSIAKKLGMEVVLHNGEKAIRTGAGTVIF